MLLLSELSAQDRRNDSDYIFGSATAVQGPIVQARIPSCSIGEICQIERTTGDPLLAQVVAFKGEIASLAPFGELTGIGPSAQVRCLKHLPRTHVGDHLLGSVVDCFGQPTHEASLSEHFESRDIFSEAPDPLERPPISNQLVTGIRSIDALFPVGYGQRLAVVAGPGSGKSTLLGMIANNASTDINVIALVGERSREVRDFLELTIQPDTLRRTVFVVATSDESAINRKLAAQTATAIAEYYRDQGKNVLLLVDSLTRMCRAIREVGLAAGELPVRQGYTASVYSELPRLIERAGSSTRGTITALYTLLSSQDIQDDPIAEEVLSLTDGHLTLSSKLATQNIRPAINPETSLSRLAERFLSKDQLLQASQISNLIARLLREKELLIFGGNPDKELSAALKMEQQLMNFLMQMPNASSDLDQTNDKLVKLYEAFNQALTESEQ